MLSDDIQRKVRALLDRANHPGTPQAEAEAALAMAYRLMAKYDLDERLITQQHDDAPRESDQIVCRRFAIVGPYRVRRNSLLAKMAGVLSCASYRANREASNRCNPRKTRRISYNSACWIQFLPSVATINDSLSFAGTGFVAETPETAGPSDSRDS